MEAASPWRRGALLYRTRDGKLYPYQPGSSEQGTWNELYFARSGSGKSATMNADNLGLVLSSGFRRLPFIRIIDIGPSSEGLIDLLREGLSPDRRHEAQFHALVNDAGWAVNPLTPSWAGAGPCRRSGRSWCRFSAYWPPNPATRSRPKASPT